MKRVLKNVFIITSMLLCAFVSFAQDENDIVKTKEILQEENTKAKIKMMGHAAENWKPSTEYNPRPKIAVIEAMEVEGQTSASRAAPANDSKCSSVVLAVDGTCTTGLTNVDATGDYTAGCATGTSSVWFSFTVSGTNNQVDLTLPNNTFGGDVHLIFFDVQGAGCGAVNKNAAYALRCGDPDGTFSVPGLVPGRTYFIQLATSGANEGTFDICLTESEDVSGTKTGPEQDCDGAIVVCNDFYTELNSYTGYWDTQELPTGATCLYGGENNSVWYTFTVSDITAGTTLGFLIGTAADYDFALYDVTSIGCEGIPTATPVRCNYSDDLGNTGLSSGTAAMLPAISNAYTGANTMASINDVYVGQRFALIIDNWTGDNNGYTLDFATHSTASLFDPTKPAFSAASGCSSNTITITMDEYVDCTTIAAGEFTLSLTDGAGADHTANISGVVGTGCGTGLTNEIVITHDGSIPSGNYKIIAALGQLSDACGNTIEIGDELTFQYLADVTISPSATTICTAGAAVTLDAVGEPAAGATFAWSPGIAGTTDNETVNPTSTTIYSLNVTYGGCTKTDNQQIEVQDNVVVAVSPVNPQLCSGTTNLTATTKINGVSCTDCDYSWNAGTFTENNVASSTWTTRPAGNYSVTATTDAGCTSNQATTTVSLASAGAGTNCGILYVEPSGAGTGLTKASPTDLESALTAALCTNTIIKCEVGTYTFDKFIEINSYVTIEGGYNDGFTEKQSDLAAGTSTKFVRSAATEDVGYTDEFAMFRSAANAENWRLQDIRIEMPTTHAASSGHMNKGIVIGTGNSGYKIVRCYIDAGTGAAQ